MKTVTKRKEAIDEKPKTLWVYAVEAFEKAKGDETKAEAQVTKIIEGDQRLFNELMRSDMPAKVHALMRQVRMAHRRTVWNAPKFVKEDSGDRVIDLARGNRMAFPLPGGGWLGDAKSDEILLGAAYYRTLSNDTRTKARWLEIVAEKVPDGKVVRDVLTEDDLTELQEEAQRLELGTNE